MEIPFKYGDHELILTISDDIDVDVKNAPREEALENPMAEICQVCQKPHMTKPLISFFKKFHQTLHQSEDYICIVISDSTRPMPSKVVLQAIDQFLQEAQIPDSRVKILIATGLHRKTTPKEMKQLLGRDFLSRFDIINHDATDSGTLEYLGENSRGSPVYLNAVYLNAKLKIITGYVEPHFFAGYSGGRKSIVPGIAGKNTILQNHSAEKINSPKARFGILKENPIYEDAQETLKMTEVRPDFVINVCINSDHQIEKVAAGAYQAHDLLVQYQEKSCFFPISHRYDVVVCGNGGFPLDLNLYQAVKSMAIGELAVKPGGTIISINECRQGIGHADFERIITSYTNPQEVVDKILSGEIEGQDQWEVQVLARVLSTAEVLLISSLNQKDVGNLGITSIDSFESALQYCINKHGSALSILVLPDGPQYLPKLE